MGNTETLYFAARYSLKPLLQRVRDWFADHGYSSTSHWLSETESPSVQLPALVNEEQAATFRNYAERDFSDIANADFFIAISEEPTCATVRGGRHVEFGFALAIKSPGRIVVVGPLENIFHYLPEVAHVRSLAQLAVYLGLQPDSALQNLDEELIHERLSI